MKKLSLFCVAVLVLSASTAYAGQVSLTSTGDSTLAGSAGGSTINFGSGSRLHIGNSVNYYRPVIMFDVSDPGILPVIDNAILKLDVDVYKATGAYSFTVYRLTEAWAEMQVTWNDRLTSTAWSSGGGTCDFTSGVTVSGTIPLVHPPDYFIDIDVTDIVQDWEDGTPAYGFVVIPDNEPSSTYYQFYSREEPLYGGLVRDPQLIINSSEGAIPEPGTMLLLGTGVLGALGYRRRRRMK